MGRAIGAVLDHRIATTAEYVSQRYRSVPQRWADIPFRRRGEAAMRRDRSGRMWGRRLAAQTAASWARQNESPTPARRGPSDRAPHHCPDTARRVKSAHTQPATAGQAAVAARRSSSARRSAEPDRSPFGARHRDRGRANRGPARTRPQAKAAPPLRRTVRSGRGRASARIPS